MTRHLKRTSLVLFATLAPLLVIALSLMPPTFVEAGQSDAPMSRPALPPASEARPLAPSLNATCHLSPTLEQFVSCVYTMALETGSEMYVVPSSTVLDDWSSVTRQMLNGACGSIPLPSNLSSNYTVTTFADNGKSYCVLYEFADADNNGKVDKGWGTFIVNNSPARELSIQAPHIKADSNTHSQAIGVFKGVGARSFILAGAHRNANAANSCVSSDNKIADPAHNRDHTFQRALSETLAYYDARGGAFNAIQFHGMGASTCPGVDVYLSHGSSSAPIATDRTVALKANLRTAHPGWVVTVPGDTPACILNATENVQGRLLNGVTPDNVCTTPASGYTGKFVHIEQKLAFRLASDWIETVKATFSAPIFTSVPVTTATQGAAYNYTVTVADVDTSDVLTLTALVKPAWLTLAGAGSGTAIIFPTVNSTATLSGVPTNAEVGAHAVVLRVQDSGGLTATQSFTITVANVNDAPTFTSAPVTTATCGTAYTYTITAADVDVGDVLTLTALVKPAWLTLAGAGNGTATLFWTGNNTATLSGTPVFTEVGAHAVTLRVQDTGGLAATQSFTVTVRAKAHLYLPLVLRP